jgi:hypothetical protein
MVYCSYTVSREDWFLQDGDDLSETLAPEALQAALQARERFIATYRTRLARAEQEARLIKQLLTLGNEPPEEEDAVLTLTIAESAEGTPLPRSRHPVVDEVARLIEAEGHPLHISEIMRLLEQRNAALPGRGDQANVIAHIRRDPRFVRPSRGVYGLASWGLRSTAGNDGPRRRIKKRVREP